VPGEVPHDAKPMITVEALKHIRLQPTGRVILPLTLMLAACQNTAVQRAESPVAIPGKAAASVVQATSNTVPSLPLVEQPREESRPSCRTCSRERDPLHDPDSPLAKREVFFGFDQYQLTPEAQALLDQHAKYLANRPQRRLRLEGHTDQRGGSEYNLALGQMRAQSVARMLMLLGVREAQLDIESFGKERPRALGNDEVAWQQNRRVDLVYEP